MFVLKYFAIITNMEIFNYLFYFFSFFFGAIMGSFLNVVSVDMEQNVFSGSKLNWKKIFNKRSSCPNCQYQLKPHNLIPLISFLVQKFKCESCGIKISWRYFWVEFFTGVLFLSIFHKLLSIYELANLNLLLNLVYVYILFALLVVIFLFDLKHKIIPNLAVYPFILLSFLYGFINFETLSLQIPNLFYFFSGILLALPFYLLWLVSSGKWIGLADSKLALGMGWFLVAQAGIFSSAASAVTLSFWIGAAVGIILIQLTKLQKNGLIFKDKNFTIKSEIPFGPFLIIGLWMVFYFGFNFFKLSPLAL